MWPVSLVPAIARARGARSRRMEPPPGRAKKQPMPAVRHPHTSDTSDTSDAQTPPARSAEAEALAFRAARRARLTSDNGWLTLIGRQLLEPGDNALPFGTVTLDASG